MAKKRGISRAQAEQMIADAVARGTFTPISGVGVNMAAFGPAPAEAPPPAKRTKKPVALVEPAFTSSARRATWTLPIHLAPTTNNGAMKQWIIGVANKHRRLVAAGLSARLMKLAWFRRQIDAGGRLACTITRLGGGSMDDDNLPPAAKWCRDTVALFLGQDDNRTGPISWHYAEEPGGACGVRITLEAT